MKPVIIAASLAAGSILGFTHIRRVIHSQAHDFPKPIYCGEVS